mmetsp:Transcript_3652/g.13439  ORF Transcript_3652/g.13439 Transcript_3652/m.13439 type:complete len:236 (-) Transcript_3652:3104-3811(-)
MPTATPPVLRSQQTCTGKPRRTGSEAQWPNLAPPQGSSRCDCPRATWALATHSSRKGGTALVDEPHTTSPRRHGERVPPPGEFPPLLAPRLVGDAAVLATMLARMDSAASAAVPNPSSLKAFNIETTLSCVAASASPSAMAYSSGVLSHESMAFGLALAFINACTVSKRRSASSPPATASAQALLQAMWRIVNLMPSVERVDNGCIALSPPRTLSMSPSSTHFQNCFGVSFQSGA